MPMEGAVGGRTLMMNMSRSFLIPTPQLRKAELTKRNAALLFRATHPMPNTHLVMMKNPEDRMAVKTGETNQEMTTGVKPLRKGNCGGVQKGMQCQHMD